MTHKQVLKFMIEHRGVLKVITTKDGRRYRVWANGDCCVSPIRLWLVRKKGPAPWIHYDEIASIQVMDGNRRCRRGNS